MRERERANNECGMGVLTGRGEIRGWVTVIGMTLEYVNMRQNHASKRRRGENMEEKLEARTDREKRNEKTVRN